MKPWRPVRPLYQWLGATLALLGVIGLVMSAIRESNGSAGRTGLRIGITAALALAAAFWTSTSTLGAPIERGLAAGTRVGEGEPVADATYVTLLVVAATTTIVLLGLALAAHKLSLLGLLGTMLGGAHLLTARWIAQVERADEATLVSRNAPRGGTKRLPPLYALAARESTAGR